MKRPAGSMRRILARGSLALTCLLAALSVAEPALAQPSSEEIDEARRLFQSALEYEQAENWSKALKLFREVGQVKLTPQVRYHIALCEENIGKPVAALGGYRLALREADSVGPGFKQEVEGRIEQLLATIPKLVIQRGKGAQAANIALDGTELGSVKIGAEVPVDPGPHTVSATAPGYEDFMATVTVEAKKTETLTVNMTKLPAEAAPTTGGTTEPEPVVWKKPSRTIPYIVGGSGAALVLTGGIFYYLRSSAIGEVEDWCGGTSNLDNCRISESGHTQSEADSKLDSARTYETVALISAGVGVAAMGVAVTMILLEPKPPPGAKTAGVRLVPLAAPSQAGLGLLGRF